MANRNLPTYYLVEADMLPEIFLKVMEAKELLQTVKATVVSAICAVLSETILAALYCCEQTLCQVELLSRRLSSCHVQRQSLSLEIVIFFLDF